MSCTICVHIYILLAPPWHFNNLIVSENSALARNTAAYHLFGEGFDLCPSVLCPKCNVLLLRVQNHHSYGCPSEILQHKTDKEERHYGVSQTCPVRAVYET